MSEAKRYTPHPPGARASTTPIGTAWGRRAVPAQALLRVRSGWGSSNGLRQGYDRQESVPDRIGVPGHAAAILISFLFSSAIPEHVLLVASLGFPWTEDPDREVGRTSFGLRACPP